MKCQLSRSASSKPNEALSSCSLESVPRNFWAACSMALPEASLESGWANQIAPIVTATSEGTVSRIQRVCMLFVHSKTGAENSRFALPHAWSFATFQVFSLPWRPCQLPSAENMQMQMIDRLPAVGPAIDHHPITPLQS